LRLGCGSCRDWPHSAARDPQICGISEGRNIRSQFNKIVRTESYQTLVEKPRTKEPSPAASGR
jgi:hypothetical protein